MFGPSVIPFYLVLVNVYLFGLMAFDKHQAKNHKWRIPESNLLFMGAIGGGFGGLLARQVFHHKTRKKKFAIFFLIGVGVDLYLLFGL